MSAGSTTHPPVAGQLVTVLSSASDSAGFTECTRAYGRRNQFRRNPPLGRRDGEEMPLAGYALELVSAAVVELES